MKRIVTIMIMALISFSAISCKQTNKIINTGQKEVSRISQFSSERPNDYSLIDYKERALEFDRLTYDIDIEGTYFPLMWIDELYNSYGIAAYVGDGRHGQDGSQEAVTNVASVLSATLLGVDKSNYNGVNYVKKLNSFFSEQEKIVINNPAGTSKDISLWYLIYPAILFSQVSFLYEDETLLRENTMKTINSWYRAAEIMFESPYKFDYSHFDFIEQQPVRNEIWREPDSAIGIAVLMYYGYILTNESRYLDMAFELIKYIENDYFGSPMYEALLYYGPYIAALFNEKFDQNFDIEKMLNKIFNGSSIPRGGWGMIVGDYGSYQMNGLMGSITDGGGYAFAMNTFTAAFAISKTAKYAPNYAESIGKWILHLTSNSRYYFPDQTNKENQSIYNSTHSVKAQEFNEIAKNNIPYEGIRKTNKVKSPWFGGDPTVYGWADTDLSMYSGAHIGLLASIIEETNVDEILKIDLNQGDFGSEYNSYLIYNPFNEIKEVVYKTNEKNVYLYDKVEKEFIKEELINNETTIKMKPNQSLVITELNNKDITKNNSVYTNDEIIIDKDYVNIIVGNLLNNDEVNSDFTILLSSYNTNKNDELLRYEIYFDNEVIKTINNKVKIKSKSKGGRQLTVKVFYKSGLSDEYTLRLNLK